MNDKVFINEELVRSILQDIDKLKQQTAGSIHLDADTLQGILSQHGWNLPVSV